MVIGGGLTFKTVVIGIDGIELLRPPAKVFSIEEVIGQDAWATDVTDSGLLTALTIGAAPEMVGIIDDLKSCGYIMLLDSSSRDEKSMLTKIYFHDYLKVFAWHMLVEGPGNIMG